MTAKCSSYDYSPLTVPVLRADSGTTDESPSGSTLGTPVDGDFGLSKLDGLVISGDSLAPDYFTPKDLASFPPAVKESAKEENEVLRRPATSLLSPTAEVAGFQRDPPQTRCSAPEMDLSFTSDFEPDTTSFSPTLSLSPDTVSFRGLSDSRKAFYNLPNEHVFIDPHSGETEIGPELSKTHEFPVMQENTSVIRDIDDPTPAISNRNQEISDEGLKESAVTRVLWSLCRAVFFLPWSFGVGACIVLFPNQLDQLAFRPGYGYVDDNLTSIRRFSHLAEYGFYYASFFATGVGAMAWLYPTNGFLVLAGLVIQFVQTWQSFTLDPSIPLGTNDQQSIAILASTLWLKDSMLVIKRLENGYYLDGGNAFDDSDHALAASSQSSELGALVEEDMD